MSSLYSIRRHPALVFLTLILALMAFALPEALAGSPFYLTINRSFANTENPQFRLDYMDSSQPMLIRVLRPKELEKFLDGQLQISRSYEEPTTELNPGHYFIKGLNEVKSPLWGLRNMLNPDFRKSFHNKALNKAIVDLSQEEIATAPEQIIIGPPQGFTVERNYFIDLQYGGTGMNDPGWWFGDSAWRLDRYKVRTITLDPLPDGIYLIQAVQGKTEAQCLMQVSSLSAQVKQSTEQLVVRVINRQLDPVSGARISYRDDRGKWMELPSRTNSFGEMAFFNPEGSLDGKLVIKIETPDKRQALVDTDFLPATSRDDSVFIVTDRPIFKPGEIFFYKGIVRALENGTLKVPDFNLKDKEARVTLIRSDGASTDLRSTVPVTDFGSFSGSFELEENQIPGLYRLVAEIGGKPYGGEFRVRDYLKPVFYLELIERTPVVVPGEKFQVKFRAKRYSGGAPKGVKYEVSLYRKKFEAPQWVVEAGGGLSAGTDYYGEIRSTSALLDPKRVYSSVEARLAGLANTSVTNSWDSAPMMEESGEATFEFIVPKIDASQAQDQEWSYTLMIRAIDRSQAQAVLTENIYMTLSEAQPVVRFSEAVARVGDKGLTVSVRSTYPDGKPVARGGGVVEIMMERENGESATLAQLPFETDDQGIRHLSLPELKDRGRLRAVATLERLGGKAMRHPAKSEPAVMIVGGGQGEKILNNRELELYTGKTILSPGEKAQVFSLLPEGWGKSESGVIWETISGHKIYETKSSAFEGRSRWFEVEARPEFGTGFYQTVTVPMPGGKYKEQTLGFRIIPWTKRLSLSIQPEREETEPLKPLKIKFEVKDAQGSPSPQTELAVTIVDRAVYAVQPEFRPGIFDFFYPLLRLNLATFYSDELQGYGYADLLKKPNFKLGALKSQSKPTKKSMRDTAGWFPHVVTDAKGQATITVDLPANVTEWVVTAIAADLEGRVGERKKQFRTVSDIFVEVLGPQFLRQGEEVSLQVKTVNRTSRSLAVRSKIGMSGEASLTEGKEETAFTLEKQGEHIQPLMIAAKEGRGQANLKVAIQGDETARIGGAEEFAIPLKGADMRQVFLSKEARDRLTVAIPEGAKVNALKVQVSSGLLGAALQAATVLVSYPYGCTEQLVHSTIPNLVLMDLVKRAGIRQEELGPLSAPLTKAERNASLGIKKIMRNQKSDGGFGLWPGDSTSSLSVTLTALYALKFAKELKIEGAAAAFTTAQQWLEQRTRKGSLDEIGILRGYTLSRFAEVSPYYKPWKEQIAFVESLPKAENISLFNLIYALRIFAASKNQEWDRFYLRFKGTDVKENLIEKLEKALDQFEPIDYLNAVRHDTRLFQSLGFGFGVPYILSAGLGVLDDLGALPAPLEAKLKKALISTMRNGFRISTFDTAQVIFNTRLLLSREAETFALEREEKPRKIIVRSKDGTELGLLSRIPSGFMGNFVEPGSAESLSEIRFEGLEENETAWATVAADIPFQKVESQSHGMVLERRLKRITPGGSEELDPDKPLRRGDLIVSEFLVKRFPMGASEFLPSHFLVIEDGIPSFAQPIDDDGTYLADARIQPKHDSYWSSIKETRRYPERTVRIAQVLPGSQARIYHVWQVAFAGRATVPPARAFDMYEESLQGNTMALSLQAE